MLIMAFIMIPILKFEEDKIGPKKSPLRRRQSRRGGIVIVIIIMMMVIIKTIIITLRKQRKRVSAIIRLAIFDSWKLGSPAFEHIVGAHLIEEFSSLRTQPLFNGLRAIHAVHFSRDIQDFLYGMPFQTQLCSAPMRQHVA